MKNEFIKRRIYYSIDVNCSDDDLFKVIYQNKPKNLTYRFVKKLKIAKEGKIE